MKTILSIFVSLFFAANLSVAQDTMYVYQGGAVLYKRAISNVDSVSFSKVYPLPTTVSDIEGHIYHTVTIGTQTWMVENLRTSKYRNGDDIPNVTDNTAWAGLTTSAWCNYNNDETTYESKYGKLYNWYAVYDSRNIAPAGWHVATNAEWNTLSNYVTANLGTSVSIAKALAATTDWTTYSIAGTIGNNPSINNYSGFNALPGGYRDFGSGMFDGIGSNGCWWSSTARNASSAWSRYLYNVTSDMSTNYDTKSTGFSVRCVRDF